MKAKLLIVILFLFVCPVMNGQTRTDLLDKIDFNDTTLIGSQKLTSDILEYIGACQDTTKTAKNQIYDVIIAVDNILAKCSTFKMYRFVYQYLISGFSELGVNALVDYMVHLPYLEFIETEKSEYDEMLKMAESYSRVQIGSKAPDIQTLDVSGREFGLYSLNADYTILLFWSANCPHCRELIKEIGAFLIESQNVAFVSVCVVGSKKSAEKIMHRSKIQNAILICDGNEWDSEIVDDYAIDMTPSIFILDQEKIIMSKPFDIADIKRIIK